MARLKYERSRGSEKGEPEAEPTKKGKMPSPAQDVRGETTGGEAAAHGLAAKHKGERAGLYKSQETDRRDTHGRQRTEHRELDARHEAEHDAATDPGARARIHRQHEHALNALIGRHMQEKNDMHHRHSMARSELHSRHEMEAAEYAGAPEKKGEDEEKRKVA